MAASRSSSSVSLTNPNAAGLAGQLDRTTLHEEATPTDQGDHSPKHHETHHSQLITQVVDWLKHEKAKRASRRARRHDGARQKALKEVRRAANSEPEDGEKNAQARSEDVSGMSDSSDGLEELEKILAQGMVLGKQHATKGSAPSRRPKKSRRRSSNKRGLHRTSSSDTDYAEGDPLVPSCDVILDNTRTIYHSDSAVETALDPTSQHREPGQGSNAWVLFKHEIVRLAHTLKLKGWRSVPLDRGQDITVERLSGALTNAVYVVSPPNRLDIEPASSLVPRKPPSKLLLRIYGAQVEHLIDRKIELQILQRLARKSIGPRLLGIFKNGRFEEYFHARTLTARDLRDPEISRQIAKRMRELHDGVELLKEERDAGPSVWKNWDKWVERAAQVVSWTDQQITSEVQQPTGSRLDAWRGRGLICGVPWPQFRRAVEYYRECMTKRFDMEKIKQQMVFAHNDTQYGNILRLEPSGESPLLLPANEHKRLVVIDFEYASANVPGLEFANHFTEWCYDYHNPSKPYALRAMDYPSPEAQRRFLRAYVEHLPSNLPRPRASPLSPLSPDLPRLISAFKLDSSGSSSELVKEEQQRMKAVEQEVERLVRQSHLWRAANSAQWVAWGVVQATIPDMEASIEHNRPTTAKDEDEPTTASTVPDEPTTTTTTTPGKRPEGLIAEALLAGKSVSPEQAVKDNEGDFDYLGYAQERAMLFWGDLITFGFISKNDLPKDLLPKIKYLNQY